MLLSVFTFQGFKNSRGILILALTWEVGEHFPSRVQQGLNVAISFLSGKILPCFFSLKEPLPED